MAISCMTKLSRSVNKLSNHTDKQLSDGDGIRTKYPRHDLGSRAAELLTAAPPRRHDLPVSLTVCSCVCARASPSARPTGLAISLTPHCQDIPFLVLLYPRLPLPSQSTVSPFHPLPSFLDYSPRFLIQFKKPLIGDTVFTFGP